MKLLIALPCYNEAENIENVISSIPKKIAGLDGIEILVVDDGSLDDTANIARGVGAIVIRHKDNLGLGITFQDAVNYAVENNFDIMVNMDGDGQFDASEIPKLIAPILNEVVDFACGSRFINKKKPENMSWIKYLGNKGMTMWINSLCKKKYTDVSCGFRAYSRKTLLHINFHGRYTYTQESFILFNFMSLVGSEIPISVKYFKDRKSRIAGSIWKYAKRTSGIILNLLRDYYPLRFFGTIALLLYAIGAIFAIMFLNHYIETSTFSGYLFAGLISAFCILVATILVSFGTAMESNVRIMQNQNRILYLLKKTDSLQNKDDYLDD